MTVGQLALQLGVTVKEAVALCRVAGINVVDAADELRPKDVEKVHAVLSGRARMLDADRLAGKAPLGSRVRTGGGGGGKAAIIVVVVLGVLVLMALGLRSLGGDASINVAAGDCFDASLFGGTAFGTSIEPKPCGQADYRAYAVLELDPVFAEWPGREAIEARAEQRCPAIAPAAVDPGESGVVQLYYFGPADSITWENPASRKIVCAEKD